MKVLRITSDDAKTFLEALYAKLKASACDDALNVDGYTPRGLIDVATIIRETCLEFEERRLAAGRKEKTVDAPPKVDEKPVV